MQAVWTAVGIAAFVLTLIVVRNVRTLERYRYTFLLLGVVALLLPSLPGVGREINGARLWVHLGPMNFQPGEAAKVLLVVFFAALPRRQARAARRGHPTHRAASGSRIRSTSARCSSRGASRSS